MSTTCSTTPINLSALVFSSFSIGLFLNFGSGAFGPARVPPCCENRVNGTIIER